MGGGHKKFPFFKGGGGVKSFSLPVINDQFAACIVLKYKLSKEVYHLFNIMIINGNRRPTKYFLFICIIIISVPYFFMEI